MLRYLLRILAVVLLVQHLEARVAEPSLLETVKSAAGVVASQSAAAQTKVFGVTTRAKFNGAAGRLKDTDTSCVMCQYFVQRIQGYSILYEASNGYSMLEENSELRPTSSAHNHNKEQPADMSNEEYGVYLEIIRRLHEEGKQSVEQTESKREAHAQKHFKANSDKWVTPEYDESTKGKGQVLDSELPDSNTHAVDLDNADGKGDNEPNAVAADEKTAAATSSPSSPAFKQEKKSTTSDSTTQKTQESNDDADDDNDDDEDDDDEDDTTTNDDDSNDEGSDDDDDSDDSDDDDNSDDDANDDNDDTSASLLETGARVKTRSKSKSRARKTKYTGLSGYSGRYRVSDQKLWRPVPARYSPVHPYLPNAASEASRMRLNQMYQLVYASFQTICTLRQPFDMAQYCGELESRYRTVAEGLRYGDRPDEICMEIDMCDKDAYIRNVAHATPPPPTSASAWIPIASNILLNYPEDQAQTNLKLALVDFNAAQTASILLQAGLIAVNQDEGSMAEVIRILGKMSGQRPSGWVKEKAYQLWVLATIIAKGSSPSATAVQSAAATQASDYLSSSQDNSGAILKLVTKFATDGYTAARSSNNDVQAEFVSLITDQ